MTTVLVVDPDPDVRATVRAALEREGFEAVAAADAESALAASDHADIAIVERRLPGRSAPDLLAELRSRNPHLHAIVLDTGGRERDRVLALLQGADDYVAKPFSTRELTARVVAARRRYAGPASFVVEAGDVRLDLVERTATVAGRPVALTRREFELLRYFVANPGQTFSRGELLATVWASSAEWQSEATVTEHVRRLRAKIERDPHAPERLVTVRPYGYRFVADVDVDGVVARAGPMPEDATLVVVAGAIVEVSGPALAVIAGTEAMVVGRPVLDFVAPSSTELVCARLALLEQRRTPRPEVLTLQRTDGRQVPAEVSSIPVTWHGRAANLVTLWPLDGDPAAAELPDVASALRTAIKNDELVVLYQPIVALEDGAVLGAEALVRWDHPERGMLLPADFIDEAERSGAIVELGSYVLDEACRQGAAWWAAGHDLYVSVNLSGRQLSDPLLYDRILASLVQAEFPADHLWLEVTETSLIQDLDEAAQVLQRLADLGVRVSIDDFGTGWGSLAYLRELPVMALKIDRVFIESIAPGTADAAIVASVISLGLELGLLVMAEGVETEEQRELLVHLGCAIGQGFLFGRPVPPGDLFGAG